MTEFDKWNSKQERIVPSDIGRLYTLVDYERKRAWQAALEWALTQETDLHHTELGAATKRELGVE